jgi:hypothetical protein
LSNLSYDNQLGKRITTKRKVDLVSSHSDDEGEGPLATYTTEGRPADDLYGNNGIPSFMRYVPKEGETVVYEDIDVPDVVD